MFGKNDGDFREKEIMFCFSFQLLKGKFIKIKTLYHINYFIKWNISVNRFNDFNYQSLDW